MNMYMYPTRCTIIMHYVCMYVCISVALGVYIRSPAAYKALQSFDILKLPSKSTLQAYTGKQYFEHMFEIT